MSELQAATTVAEPQAQTSQSVEAPAQSGGKTGIVEALEVYNKLTADKAEIKEPTKTVEAKTETKEPVSEPKEDADISKQLAALAKAERKNREEKAALKAEREQAKQELDRIKALSDNAKDPVKFLESALGNDWYKIVTERVLNNGKPSDIEIKNATTSETQQLRQELEAMKKQLTFKEQATQQQAAYNDYVSEVSKEISGDDYELLRESGGVDEIMTYVNEVYNQTQQLVSPRDAVVAVNDTLREQLEKLSKTNTFKKLFGQIQEEKKQTKTEKQTSGETIRNEQTTRTTDAANDFDGDEDDEIAIRRAATMIKWLPESV